MAKKQIRPFDFSKIKKLSSKGIAITSALLQQYPQLSEAEDFGKNIIQTFSSELDLSLDLKYVGFEEGSHSSFLSSFSSPCVGIQLRSEPREGEILLEIDYGLCRLLVNKALGGSESSPEDLGPLSPLEEGVLEFLLAKALKQIKDGSGVMGPVSLRITKIVNEAKMLAGSSSPEEIGVVFKFYLGLGDQGGYLKIYFPHPLVEGIFLREDIMMGVVPPEEEGLLEKRLNRVNHIKTSLWSEVGRVKLSVSEKTELEKGDVILFDESLVSMGSHGLAGKAVLRVGENISQGLLAEVLDTEGKVVLKILDYYGG